MKSPQIPANEARRLLALRNTRLLDTPPERKFDDLVELAAKICDVPIALISLVDKDRQWFKARRGLEATETPREIAFCAHAINETQRPLIVEDATLDDRFSDNPIVTGEPRVIFYAGMPLISNEGHGLGTLCVIDHQPRTLDPGQRAALESLQRLANELIQQREVRNAADQLLEGWDLLENIGDMIQSTGPDGRLRFVNAAWRTRLGYSQEEAQSLSVFDVIAPESRAHCAETMGRVQRGEELPIKASFVTKSGEIFPVRGLANCRIQDGEPVATRAILRDASAQVMQEAVLAASETRHRGTLAAVLDAVVTIRPDGTVVGCNPSTTTLFGYEAEEVVGKNVKLLMPQPYRDEHDGYLERYMTTGISRIIGRRREVTGRRKDGSTFPAELTIARVELQEELLFTGMVRDLTQSKEAERAKDEFISTVSHELRTPLTSIRGALGLLEGGIGGTLAPKALEMLRIARSNSDRLIRLINDILDFEKISANKLELELQTCDACALVSDAVSSIAGMASEHSVTIEVELPDEPPHVRADPNRVAQVLANLLSNALKFSDEGQQVTVSVSETEFGARFSIRDRGAGIRLEDQSRLFQRFQQLDASATRKVGGTGLGLAITKAIVEQHKGLIGFESELGAGATFWFELPRARTKPDSSALLRSPDNSVLVVEDDDDVSLVLKALLSGEGYAVSRAASVMEAEEFLSKHTPMAVLLDLALPDGNGLQVLEHREEDLRRRGIPVIVVSGREPTRADYSHPLLMDWVVKPFDHGEVLRALRRAVRRHDLARVLVVEDDPDIRQIIVAQLDEVGVETIEAADGVQALDLIRSARPDLLVLDLGIPRLNGFEVVEILQREIGGAHLPMIVYSARDLTELDREHLRLGVTRFLSKTRATMDEFKVAVRDLLRGLNPQSP